ncbi:MAG: hypothetical protein ACE5I7_10385 [Candidatus Binatia bacterium]
MEKVVFNFKNGLLELEVRKIKRSSSVTSDYGKVLWRVTKASIPGGAVKVGCALPSRRVFFIAKDIDPRAAHAFDMENQA